MQDNPFEVKLDADWIDEQEDLDVLMKDIRSVNSMSWRFNPIHHRVINWIVSLLPSFKSKVVYSLKESYVEERRSMLAEATMMVHMFFMTKTKKIEIIE